MAKVFKTKSCNSYVMCWDCAASTDEYTTDNTGSAEENAKAAWNRRYQPDPKPLTLEELKECGGEPVWIIEYPEWGHWELSECGEDYLEDRDEAFYGMKHNDPAGRFGLHALGWLAYRYKPDYFKED